jgi:hypothetical protein
MGARLIQGPMLAPPSPEAARPLEARRKAVQHKLEEKRRLGHYYVVWEGERPIFIGDDAPDVTGASDRAARYVWRDAPKICASAPKIWRCCSGYLLKLGKGGKPGLSLPSCCPHSDRREDSHGRFVVV